jgi:hypothetical protein
MMKKLFCYLFGHSIKKSKDGDVNSFCTICGDHFIYDKDLDHYFTNEEISTKIDEEVIQNLPGVFEQDNPK